MDRFTEHHLRSRHKRSGRLIQYGGPSTWKIGHREEFEGFRRKVRRERKSLAVVDNHRRLNGRPMTRARDASSRCEGSSKKEKRKGERGRTKIAIQQPWNSSFLTGRGRPHSAFVSAGTKRRTRDERQPTRPKVSLLRDSLGFSLYWHPGFTSVPSTISIDARVKTAPPPAADQSRTHEIDALRTRLEG